MVSEGLTRAATAFAVLVPLAGITACADSERGGQPRDAMPDSGSFVVAPLDAGALNDAARACPFGSWQCVLGEACVEDVCAESATCDGARVDGPIRCLDWADLQQLGTATSPFERVELLVDGGVEALGTEDDFRCPRVSELRANVGGEASGDQPVCGPDAILPLADDAGDQHLCCYGSVRVAGI